MRKFGLLGSLVLGYGALSTLSTPSMSPEYRWTAKVEREVRKHDPWVEEHIEADYRTPHLTTSTGKVRINRVPRRIVQAMKRLGMVGFSGAYSPELDVLSLPELDDDKDDDVIDSIDHELWHAIFDNKGKKGIFYSPEFSGPSLEEIAEYTEKKTSGANFQPLWNRLRSEEELERIKSILPIFARYARVISRAHTTSQEIDGLMAEQDYDAHMSKEERGSIAADKLKLDERLRAFASKAKEILSGLQDLGISVESRKEIPPLDELVRVRNNIADGYKTLEEYSGIDKQYGNLRERTRNMYHAAEDKFFQARIDEMKALRDAEKNDAVRKRLTEEITTSEELDGFRKQDRAMEALPDLSAMLVDAFSNIESVLSSSVSANNVYKIDQILGNPNEVMGRVVDSLYSIYLGEVTQNKFPLTAEDLDFLRSFRFRGEVLFRKGIERYEVGLQLKGEGVSDDEIRRSLEYATSFSHRGKHYYWPAAQFGVKGVIPEFVSHEQKDHK